MINYNEVKYSPWAWDPDKKIRYRLKFYFDPEVGWTQDYCFEVLLRPWIWNLAGTHKWIAQLETNQFDMGIAYCRNLIAEDVVIERHRNGIIRWTIVLLSALLCWFLYNRMLEFKNVWRMGAFFCSVLLMCTASYYARNHDDKT